LTGGKARERPDVKLSMANQEDARTRELDNLRLALATFALQLDAFEMRMGEARLSAEHSRSYRLTALRPQHEKVFRRQ
jgi:hypothetical protein